jgi:hypothetical protein
MKAETKRWIGWSLGTAVGLGLILSFVGPFIRYKEVDVWICPVSGSTRIDTVWLGLFKHEERTTSALEGWLKHREPAFVPNWQHTSTDNYFVLGRSFACSTAPEIFTLTPLLNQVVEKLDDNEISDLVKVLRLGSADDQHRVVQKVAEDVIGKS